MNLLPRRRICYTFGFVSATALIFFALYLQQVLGQDPCPLCIFQRVAMVLLGTQFLIALLHNPSQSWATRSYAIMTGATAFGGAAIAARQVWLQHLPADQVPSCGPGLQYILQAHPIFKALEIILKGSGECATVGWTFASLSIPEWALIWFLLLGGMGLLQPFNRR